MSANLEAKKQLLEEIKVKMSESKCVLLLEYNKLTVAEVTALRTKFREAGCEYKVYKNTLVQKAFAAQGIEDFKNDLQNPTAVVFSKDEMSAVKVYLAALKADKALEEKLVAKSACLDGAYIAKAKVAAIATMPTKEQLIAKMLGSINAPATNLAGVLNNVIRGIVNCVDARRKQLEEN